MWENNAEKYSLYNSSTLYNSFTLSHFTVFLSNNFSQTLHIKVVLNKFEKKKKFCRIHGVSLRFLYTAVLIHGNVIYHFQYKSIAPNL